MSRRRREEFDRAAAEELVAAALQGREVRVTAPSAAQARRLFAAAKRELARMEAVRR